MSTSGRRGDRSPSSFGYVMHGIPPLGEAARVPAVPSSQQGSAFAAHYRNPGKTCQAIKQSPKSCSPPQLARCRLRQRAGAPHLRMATLSHGAAPRRTSRCQAPQRRSRPRCRAPGGTDRVGPLKSCGLPLGPASETPPSPNTLESRRVFTHLPAVARCRAAGTGGG